MFILGLSKKSKIMKVSRKELAQILGVSSPTASKEYKMLLEVYEIKRSFLTTCDLEKIGIIEKNIKKSPKK